MIGKEKTVFKYPVGTRESKFSLMLPMGFRFLRIQFQNDVLCIWAEVKKDVLQAKVDFQLFGTGQDIPRDAQYLQTFDNGPFVLHLYQLN